MSGPGAPPAVIVVVPTYNERPNIEALTLGVLAQGPGYRVLIVDDNSPDGAGALADTLAAAYPGRVEALHRAAKGGLGPAYVAGFRRALAMRPDFIVQMDADFSHDPNALPRLVAAAQRAGLVVGSRYVAGGGVVGWPVWRRALSRWGGWYARLVLGAPVADLTSGFKVWRPETLRGIGIDHLRSDGYGFTIETTWRALRGGAAVVEEPIVFTDRIAGASKLSRRIVLEAALLVWALRGEGTGHPKPRGARLMCFNARMRDASPKANPPSGFAHRILEHLSAAKTRVWLLRQRLRRGQLDPAEAEAHLDQIETQVDQAATLATNLQEQASPPP